MALKHIGKLERYYRIHSENPLEDIWNDILRLTDFHYLAPRWKDHSEAEMITVVTLLRQAYEYYIASKSTSLLTRPVLSYYSFLNLAKALIFLVNDRPPSEFHGLCRHEMTETLLDVSVASNNGVFLELGSVYGAALSSGHRFSLEDFVLNCVELRFPYQEYFSKSPSIVSPYVDVYTDGRIVMTFTFGMLQCNTLEEGLATLNERTALIEDFVVVDAQPSDREIVLQSKTKTPHPNLHTTGSVLMDRHCTTSVLESDEYCININSEEKRLPGALAYFGTMFLLSCIVRYAPMHIDAFVNAKQSSVSWFFRELCERAERAFPNLVLNVLKGFPHKYSPSFSF